MYFEPNASRATADFHTIFNVILALLFIFPLNALATLLTRLLPEQKKSADLSTPLYLDESAIPTPSVALACAARETLHIGNVIETMLRQSLVALKTDDRKLVQDVAHMDDAVDQLHEAVKLYVTRITRASLTDQEGKRAMEVISFAINLEHVGDIIDKNLLELVTKKMKRRISFSKEGFREIETFHQEVIDNLKLAFGVFMSGDVKVARQLIAEKTQMRSIEFAATESHLARLREGRPESIESSSLHLDILRDLKRIHSHICSVAYPVLERAGDLTPNRLKDASSAQDDLGRGLPVGGR